MAQKVTIVCPFMEHGRLLQPIIFQENLVVLFAIEQKQRIGSHQSTEFQSLIFLRDVRPYTLENMIIPKLTLLV